MKSAIISDVDMYSSYHGDLSSEMTVRMYGETPFAAGDDISEWIPIKSAVTKCAHCGQWGAVRCECKYCGAPIDD